jgi:D-alanine-D-alanine ligase-like ATP-grasp enzyme
VDIIYDKHGRPYVLEVNTAPALVSSEDRIMAWAEAFKEAYDA